MGLGPPRVRLDLSRAYNQYTAVAGSGGATCPAGAGTGASLPLEDSPTHRIQGVARVKPHCRPHITEVHSVAACAASAQSPSAALNGYDGTTPFHHTANTASYTTGYDKLRPGAVSTRQGMAMPDGRFP